MKRILVIGLLIMLVATESSLTRANEEGLESTVAETVNIHQQTQQSLDSWADERLDLLRRLTAAEANVAYLTDCKLVTQDHYQRLLDRVAELERRLDESDRLTFSLTDSLRGIAERLENVVAHDLPFLFEERSLRLKALSAELIRSDVPTPEKLRRLLEALQIEAQYGGEVELYQDRIVVEGDSLYVDMLRVGRLGAYWQTPDGSRAGQYDIAQQLWLELPGKYHRTIKQAIEMTQRQRSADLIDLPLGRISR